MENLRLLSMEKKMFNDDNLQDYGIAFSWGL